MSLSITQILTPVTADQVRAKFVQMLNVLGIPADQWRKGGVASSILTVASMTYANFSSLMAFGLSAQFLSKASGDGLTLLAQDGYNVVRGVATFASGALTLVNAGGGIFSFGPGEVTVQNASTLKTYTNTAALVIGAGATVTANFQAQTAGAASNANPGDISVLVTQLLGVAVTNLVSFVGLDPESDQALVAQCQSKLGSLSPGGPAAAYQYAVDIAVNSVTGLPVTVNRRNVQTDPTTGTVQVIAASPGGVVVATDITGIINSIVAVAVPDAVSFHVQSATPVSYSPTITIWVQGLPGISASDIATAAATAITNYIENYPIGGLAKGGTSALWGSGVAGAIEDVNAAIFAVDGATDLVLLAAQVATDSVPIPIVNVVPSP